MSVKAVSPAESGSIVSICVSPDHETESPDQTVSQQSPNNSSDGFDMAVRELAYFKWEAAGFPEGDGFDFWPEAERELHAIRSLSTPASE